MTNPITPNIDAHTWGRGTGTEIPGAIIYIGRRELFITHEQIPAAIARLEAIHALEERQ